ncbi:MAG: hypothetical protein A2X45_23095 [Lentisphaerae bacterium GWF2_50_93]|nr:MAG: hypothetical protein A2X45_23095 [Lentisphaerae bacterium GWF2_50_93]
MDILHKYDRDDLCYKLSGRTFLGAGLIKKDGMKLDWAGGSAPHFSMSLVLRGTGCYIVSSTKKKYPLNPGSVFFRIPGILHSNTIDPNSRWLEFFIAFRFFKPGISKDIPNISSSNRKMDEDSWLLPMSEHLLGLSSLGLVRKTTIDPIILEECDNFLNRLKKESGLPVLPVEGMHLMMRILHGNLNPAEDELVIKASELISENVLSWKPLPKILSSLPISYMRLRERFLKAKGQNIGHYLIQCRMEKAINMLQNGMSIKEVSVKLNYKDPFFFSKQFSRFFGYPPSMLKRRIHGNSE